MTLKKKLLMGGAILVGAAVGPAAVLIIAGASKLTGAAALAYALATFGPGGMTGGIVTTGVTSGVCAVAGEEIVDHTVD